MNTPHPVAVDHHEGMVFNKYQADSGITYFPVDPSEASPTDRSLLVRHGNPETGRCGYYPLWLIFRDKEARLIAAAEARKRPPSECWVNHIKTQLEEAGVRH